MPLLPSTQTQTANGVPLYVPMDSEGNVPEPLTVQGSITSVTSVGNVNLGDGGGFPSIVFTNPQSTPNATLIGLQDTGTLLVGNNGATVATLGNLNVGGILGVPVTAGSAGSNFFRIGPYAIGWFNVTTGGDGGINVILPTGLTGSLVGGSGCCVGDQSGENNYYCTFDAITNGVTVGSCNVANNPGTRVSTVQCFGVAVFLVA